MRRWRSGGRPSSCASAPTSGRSSCAILLSATDDQIFPEGGGLQIRNDAGDVIGAIGVTGDTEDKDEELATFGIRAAGLKIDDDFKDMGRRSGVRLTQHLRTRSRGAEVDLRCARTCSIRCLER